MHFNYFLSQLLQEEMSMVLFFYLSTLGFVVKKCECMKAKLKFITSFGQGQSQDRDLFMSHGMHWLAMNNQINYLVSSWSGILS